MRNKVIRFLSLAGIITCVILLLVWAGRIKVIDVIETETPEHQLEGVAMLCLESIKNRSLWTLSEKTVVGLVTTCDPTFRKVRIKQQFPQRLRVEITMFTPVIKVAKDDATCILLENSAERIELPLERCLAYKIPFLTGKDIESNVFVQEYATELQRKLKEQQVIITSIEYKGDSVAPWYELSLEAGGKAFFPSSATISDKVIILRASLNGLYEAKERYSIVDVRFDRVYYK